MEKLSKNVLVVASALYAVGVLSQNVVLATVGASDLLLLRTRGIFVGAWVVVIFVAAAAMPIWVLLPWLLPTLSHPKPSTLCRGIVASFAILFPASIFCLINRLYLGVTGSYNLIDSWVTVFRVTCLAVLTAMVVIFTWRERLVVPRRWGRVGLLAIVTCIMVTVYVEQASYEIVLIIPASYGGAKARYVRLVTKPEIGKIMLAAGVQFTPANPKIGPTLQAAAIPSIDQNEIVTQPLNLIDESDSEIIIVLPLLNGQRQYFSSLDLKKSDIVAVLSEPSSGSKDDKEGWAHSPTWPPK